MDSLLLAARLVPHGDALYERVLGYEEAQLEDRQSGVEPGTRLAYLVPMLLRHGVTDEDLTDMARQPDLDDGVRELVARVHDARSRVFLLTVAPYSYATAVASQLRIPEDHVAATVLSLERLSRYLLFHGGVDMERVAQVEDRLLGTDSADSGAIRSVMDGYLQWLGAQPAGGLLSAVKPMGGRRKSQALRSLGRAFGFELEDVAVSGRLPLDRQLLTRAHHFGGLAVLYGVDPAGKYRRITVTVPPSVRSLGPVIDAWVSGGRATVRDLIEGGGAPGARWIAG